MGLPGCPVTAIRLPPDIEALILESAEMVPAADLDRAGKALLIVLVGAFDHQQRRIVELEIEAVIVADLRVVLAAGRSGIAVIDADQELRTCRSA